MSDEPGENQYQDLAVSGLPTDSNPADKIAGESEELERIKRVGKQRAENLRDAGFNTIVDIRNADVEEISAINDIGENTAAKIIAGDVSELTGIGDKRATQLREAGFQTATDIVKTDPDELGDISGIGDTLVTRFKIEAAGYEFTGGTLSIGEESSGPVNIRLSVKDAYSPRRLWAIRSIGIVSVLTLFATGIIIDVANPPLTLNGPLFGAFIGGFLGAANYS